MKYNVGDLVTIPEWLPIGEYDHDGLSVRRVNAFHFGKEFKNLFGGKQYVVVGHHIIRGEFIGYSLKPLNRVYSNLFSATFEDLWIRESMLVLSNTKQEKVEVE